MKRIITVSLISAIVAIVGYQVAVVRAAETPALLIERISVVASALAEISRDYLASNVVRIEVDGDLGEWKDIAPTKFDRRDLLGGDSGRYPNSWGGTDDMSAKVWFAWDDANLYVATEVVDDVFEQHATRGNLWDGDGLVIAIDPLNDATSPSQNTSDDKEFYLVLHETDGPILMDQSNRQDVDGGRIAASRTTAHPGWRLEASIPWTAIGGFTPAGGKVIGFAALMNDGDGTGQEGWFQTAQVIYGGGSPAQMGDMVFVSDGASPELSVNLGTLPAQAGIDDLVGTDISISSPWEAPAATLKLTVKNADGVAVTSLDSKVSLEQGSNRLRMSWKPRSAGEGEYTFTVSVNDGSGAASDEDGPVRVGSLGAPDLLDPFRPHFSMSNVRERLTQSDPGEGETFRFAVTGDTRGGDQVYRMILKEVNRRNAENPIAFLAISGDLVHNGWVSQWVQFLGISRGSQIPIVPVVGNHDIGTGRAEYRYIFGEKTDLFFDYGNSRFVVMDNGGGENFTEEQMAWLDSVLAAATGHKFVFAHKPPSVIEKWAGHSFNLRAEEFCGLMTKHQVDNVYLGHIHAFSTQIYNGVKYTIAGGGGVGMGGSFGDKGDDHHVVIVEVSPNGIKETLVALEFTEDTAINEELVK